MSIVHYARLALGESDDGRAGGGVLRATSVRRIVVKGGSKNTQIKPTQTISMVRVRASLEVHNAQFGTTALFKD